MYQRLSELELPMRSGRVLSISDSENLASLLRIKATEIVPANYPEHNILALRLPDSSFDFVLSDQVLEHVEGDPQTAINECWRVLRSGGIAVHTTCFINPVHGAPKDFWRFTPEALRLLHLQWSEILECGGWGNFDVWDVVAEGMRFVGIPHAKWHPLHKIATRNDPLWPISVWVVARK
jgi:SAM-dependent methyltransferase